MKGWQFTGAGQPLRLIEREDPRPGPRDVVVAVKAAGLCHTDVGHLQGEVPTGSPPPMILGHEVAGTIADVGAEVTEVRIGDRVVAPGVPTAAPGWSIDGGYATHCLVKAKGVIPLPDAVSFVQGATATDAGSTSYGAVMLAGELEPGQRVGIIGLGGLGMTGARVAVLNGASVYAAEPREQVWDTARRSGVLDVVSDVHDLPHDLDLVVDFAGFETTTADAIHVVRPRGLVIQVGLGRKQTTIPTFELVLKAVTLRGARGGMPGAIDAVLRHMTSGELAIEATTIGFDEIPEGLARLDRGGVVGRLVAVVGQ